MLSNDDLIQSLRDALKQRLGSPIFGFFILAWFAFNWQAVAIFVYSEASISSILLMLEENHLGTGRTLVYPLLYAIGASLAFPVLAFVPILISDFSSNSNRRYRNYLVRKTAPSAEEYRAFLDEFDRSSIEHNEEASRLRSRVSDLEKQVEAANDRAIKYKLAADEEAAMDREKLKTSADIAAQVLSPLESVKKDVVHSLDAYQKSLDGDRFSGANDIISYITEISIPMNGVKQRSEYYLLLFKVLKSMAQHKVDIHGVRSRDTARWLKEIELSPQDRIRALRKNQDIDMDIRTFINGYGDQFGLGIANDNSIMVV